MKEEPNLRHVFGRHPLDDRILWHDLDGDGLREAFIPDSGGRRLIKLHFRQDPSGP